MLSRVGRAVVEEVVGGAAGVCEQIRSGQLRMGARRVVARRVGGDEVVCGVVLRAEASRWWVFVTEAGGGPRSSDEC